MSRMTEREDERGTRLEATTAILSLPTYHMHQRFTNLGSASIPNAHSIHSAHARI